MQGRAQEKIKSEPLRPLRPQPQQQPQQPDFVWVAHKTEKPVRTIPSSSVQYKFSPWQNQKPPQGPKQKQTSQGPNRASVKSEAFR